MKKALFLILMICCTISGAAQNTTPSSLICSFTQVKQISMMEDNLVAQGKMYYSSPDKIRWEYTQPLKQIFICNGESAYIFKPDTQERTLLKDSHFFNGIIKVMKIGLMGNWKGQSEEFEIEEGLENGVKVVTLTPIKKNIKRMFKSMVIHISNGDELVKRVTINEINGDTTTIDMHNTVLNTVIPEDTFTL